MKQLSAYFSPVIKGKGKSNVYPITGHEAPYGGIALLFL
jgi:hypothetical protein